MDGFELNKIAGGILAALLVSLGGMNVGKIVYAPHPPLEPGWRVDVPEGGTSVSSSSAEAIAPIGERLLSADASAGMREAKKCLSCHLFVEGGGNKLGPNLYGIAGRGVGEVEGFVYSKGLARRKDEIGVWNDEALDAFLAKPKSYVPGTSMAFAGVRKPDKRADLILYLRSVSPDAPPLER